jgi:hypothetical protein
MAFDDLARRMGAQPGSASGTTDPDQIIAEAQIAARRAARTRDLVLGVLLLVGGAIIVVLWLSVYARAITTSGLRSKAEHDVWGSYYIVAAGAGAIIVGVHKLLRGIGVLKRRA